MYEVHYDKQKKGVHSMEGLKNIMEDDVEYQLKKTASHNARDLFL